MNCCSPTKLVGAQVHWIQVRKKNTPFAKYFSTVCPPGLEGFPWLAYSWSSKALVCFALSAQLWMVWDWLHGLHKWYQIATLWHLMIFRKFSRRPPCCNVKGVEIQWNTVLHHKPPQIQQIAAHEVAVFSISRVSTLHQGHEQCPCAKGKGQEISEAWHPELSSWEACVL